MSDAEQMVSVLYSSSASEPMDGDGLTALLRQSRASNEESDLTGMLLYRGGRFIQVLEGPRSRVHDLLGTIEADDRHTNMRVLVDEPIDQRRFPEWTMGFEPIAVPVEKLPEGFRSTFDDLDQIEDPSAVMRAARELTMWFRVRSNHAATN